jgi:hypothetical protein
MLKERAISHDSHATSICGYFTTQRDSMGKILADPLEKVGHKSTGVADSKAWVR